MFISCGPIMRQRPFLTTASRPSFLPLPKKQGCPITHTLTVCNRPHNVALASFDPRQSDWPLISGPRSCLVYLNGIWIICLLVQKLPNSPKFEKRRRHGHGRALFDIWCNWYVNTLQVNFSLDWCFTVLWSIVNYALTVLLLTFNFLPVRFFMLFQTMQYSTNII